VVVGEDKDPVDTDPLLPEDKLPNDDEDDPLFEPLNRDPPSLPVAVKS